MKRAKKGEKKEQSRVATIRINAFCCDTMPGAKLA